MSDAFLTIGELEANTRRLEGDPRVTITPVGASWTGRPIEMISMGEGKRDALVVGVPHPNEPAGAVTVERMIALLLQNESQRRGYRWHFIKAIDPEGLRLNEGWLKRPRTLTHYLENIFRPALHRQPETTFPLDTPDFHFDRSTPENKAWQRAFALTRPCLHASLHHCDFGGAFYSISRALPAALQGLEDSLVMSGFGVNSAGEGIMAADQWSPSVTRYPSAPELANRAKASGDAWAYPWTLGEMSPGFGEAAYGAFTVIPEAPMWDSAALHSNRPSGVSRRQRKDRLEGLVARTDTLVRRYVEALEACAPPPDAREFLWAIQDSLKMAPARQDPDLLSLADADALLTLREFDDLYTHPALYVLRAQGYLMGFARSVLAERPGHALARRALEEARESLRYEITLIEAHSTLVPVALDALTGFQMRAVFVCADALA